MIPIKPSVTALNQPLWKRLPVSDWDDLLNQRRRGANGTQG